MKVPSYIRKLIDSRARYASRYLDADSDITEWCELHNVKTEMISGHVETIMDPYGSSEQLIRDIENSN